MLVAVTCPPPLQTHPSAWPFMEPVKKSEAPDYYEIIRFPIGRSCLAPRAGWQRESCRLRGQCWGGTVTAGAEGVLGALGQSRGDKGKLLSLAGVQQRGLGVRPDPSLLPDLKTMTERLKNRYYVTKKLFIADLQRIITNCREYNPPDSDYCKCANTLEKFFYFKLKEGGLIDK